MKEELDQTESFKILQDAADGLRGIPDIHNKKDPVVKKWDEAKATVPKKHREAFYEKTYEEARNDKEWQRDRLREEDGSQDLSNKRKEWIQNYDKESILDYKNKSVDIVE